MMIVEDKFEVIQITKSKKFRVIEGRNTNISYGVMKFISIRNRMKKN